MVLIYGVSFGKMGGEGTLHSDVRVGRYTYGNVEVRIYILCVCEGGGGICSIGNL